MMPKNISANEHFGMAAPDEIRKQLAKLCRSTRTRTETWTRKRPNRWSPETICAPGTIDAFTNAGAWEFIAQCLDDGVDIEVMTLDKPPGKTGYVMLVPGNHNESIYIKLEIAESKVIGRSFHVSEKRNY